jgi:tetratricopeptide (TPR) repeat protein
LKKHLPLLVTLLVTFVIFWPVTNGEYLAGWDDDQQILNNPDVTNLSWSSIQNYFTTYYVASYQPLASLSFGIEYYFFGENAFVHHFTNLLLHLLNVFLLYQLLIKLFKEKVIMILFVTSIFALHPLQTELVGWISTRSTLLYAGTFFLSCIFYLNYLIKEDSKSLNLGLCVLFFALSLFSKATAVTLPIVLLLLDYYVGRKVSWRMFLEKVPMFIYSVMIGLASIDSRKVLDSIGDFRDYYTFFEKIALSSYTLLFYLFKTIIPTNLYTYYGYPMKIDEDNLGLLYLISPLILVGVLGLIYWVYIKSKPTFKREWMFGFLFFAINIGLVINFTPFGPTMVAERYNYLPIIGIAICLGLLMNELLKRTKFKNAVYAVFGLMLMLFAIQSRKQSYIWESSETLWKNAIEHTNGVYPWMELGNEYQKRGLIDLAIEYYNGGVKLNPYYTNVYYYRGMAVKTKGDKAYAKIDFERVIKSDGAKKGDAFYERGLLYEEMNMLDSAIVDYDSSLFYKPESPAMFRKRTLTGGDENISNQGALIQRIGLMMTRGDSLMQTGALAGALEVFDNVLMINPGMATALMSKGLIQSAQADFAGAVITFTTIIEYNPANQRARLSRAFAYTQTKEFQKSVEDYNYVTEVLGERTGEVLYFKAIALLNMGQKEEACKDLTEAGKLGYQLAADLKMEVCL